ncbi:hypothetical protein GCM10008927_01730 [Amylibacter ulvae]|uniref:DUF4760 domain-containing protein n=1 Tax=Paramylibacter ulvae TaxID=1651968 RepID=A0ABQ3CVQ8_9RHOB|nr:hypothetical protein [Amylibacter ulvae]GHA41097.1 hypothetical protein GCM10008927_01730 [Amylibacter ulvae]
MSDPIHWIEYVKAFGPILVAIVVGYIAYQQWQVNRASFKEKMFDRRYTIYKGTQKFLGSILRSARVEDEEFFEFMGVVEESKFLFGSDVSSYLEEIRVHSIDMRLSHSKYQNLPVGDERSEFVAKEHAELKWLNDQLGLLVSKFEKYINFGKF